MTTLTPTLTATYTTTPQTMNPPFTITIAIAAPTPPSQTPLEQKTAYLRSLRAAVLGAQEEINKELTQRMEEDNARAGGGGAGRDAKDEENYGEEMVEED